MLQWKTDSKVSILSPIAVTPFSMFLFSTSWVRLSVQHSNKGCKFKYLFFVYGNLYYHSLSINLGVSSNEFYKALIINSNWGKSI